MTCQNVEKRYLLSTMLPKLFSPVFLCWALSETQKACFVVTRLNDVKEDVFILRAFRIHSPMILLDFYMYDRKFEKTS